MPKRRYYYNGKRVSKGEFRIAKFLKGSGIKFQMEKTFKGCVNGKNNLLRFDFFLPQSNILIEFQGHHHYFPVNKGRRAKVVHEKTVVHDNIKKEYCITNNIGLLEIKYDEFDYIEDIITNVLTHGEL